jgi:hypothetical protein
VCFYLAARQLLSERAAGKKGLITSQLPLRQMVGALPCGKDNPCGMSVNSWNPHRSKQVGLWASHQGTSMKQNPFQCISVGAAVAAILGGVAIHSPAAHSAEQSADALDEVTVTGSRIVRRDFESSSPILTVGSEL